MSRQIPNIASCLLAIALLWAATGCQQPKPTERMPGFSVHGIDVSHYQQRIVWDSVAREDIRFAFAKASEGREYRDSVFCHNWDEIGRVGLFRGAYHFFVPSVPAREQAFNFMGTVSLQAGDMPPVLDFERTNGKAPEVLRAQLREWLQTVGRHYGVRPIIYTNQDLYHQYIKGYFPKHLIWVARYNTKHPEMPEEQPWTFWQYGNRGRMKGIEGPVDFNVFNGDASALRAITLPEKEQLGASVSYSPTPSAARPR